MKKQLLLMLAVAFGFLFTMMLVPICQAQLEPSAQVPSEEPAEPQLEAPDESAIEPEAEADAVATENASGNIVPTVFQAAGPSVVGFDPISGLELKLPSPIEGAVDVFRAALGEPNRGNDPGPFDFGRREINWDGGGNNNTTAPFPPETPFNDFLNSRGAQFRTPGVGFTQAPLSGLVLLFNNATYGTIFNTFSPLRLFTPVGSNITNVRFFIPGSNGAAPATVRGFGAVFIDVDQPSPRKNRPASTLIQYFGVDGRVLFSSFVPASPGDARPSFFGIVFQEPLIARVRIITGSTAPGPNDNRQEDIVMMDDFIYGEPQPLPVAAP